MHNRNKLPFRQSTLGIVINNEGEFLLVNKQSYGENQWSFPGGGIDRNETPEMAIKRELAEELLTDRFEIIGQSQFPYLYEWPDDVIETAYKKNGQYFRGTELTQFWVKFIGTSNEVKAGDDIKAVKWVTRKELKTHLIFSNQWESAEKVIQEFIK